MGRYEGIPSLIMVGTVHRDPKGYPRLLQLLEREQPALVTVELSPYGRIFRGQKAAALRTTLRENLWRIKKEEGRQMHAILSQSAILGIFFLLKEPYEWQAAKAYADRYGIFLRDIDLSCYSEDKLSHLSELLSLENLHTLLRIPFPNLSKQVETEYSRARTLFLHPSSNWSATHEARAREAHMAEKIRSLVYRVEGKKVLHIGGWEHLIEYSQGKSLFGLLQDLRPQRILLSSLGN